MSDQAVVREGPSTGECLHYLLNEVNSEQQALQNVSLLLSVVRVMQMCGARVCVLLSPPSAADSQAPAYENAHAARSDTLERAQFSPRTQ